MVRAVGLYPTGSWFESRLPYQARPRGREHDDRAEKRMRPNTNVKKMTASTTIRPAAILFRWRTK